MTEPFGPVSLLAPFAGGFGRFEPVAEMDLSAWRQVGRMLTGERLEWVKQLSPWLVLSGSD